MRGNYESARAWNCAHVWSKLSPRQALLDGNTLAANTKVKGDDMSARNLLCAGEIERRQGFPANSGGEQGFQPNIDENPVDSLAPKGRVDIRL